ncbi:MAG: helix-turn-helix transcriptional regulator [Butyrivibrio sp.]|nr:helix-turn-helix transcriptional regulator [Butyrivibrio sp.]
MDNLFSISLRKIRKQRGVTQEQLADAVGVSAQAVSKWEISSYPDAGLLPAIADFLGVTIDELFGKTPAKEVSFYQKTIDYMRGFPYDERAEKAFEICRACIIGYMNRDEYVPIAKSVLESVSGETHSQITDEKGWLQARLNGNLQYFFLMRAPECGYDSVLKYDEKMVELFNFLSKPDALRAMYFLAGRPTTMLFTVNALAAELDVSEEKARSLINDMLKFNFIWEADLNAGQTDNSKIYQWLVDCNFVSFINFTRTLLCIPKSFNYQTDQKHTPFFTNDTYRKDKTDEKQKE